jgi:hypothetical protein
MIENERFSMALITSDREAGVDHPAWTTDPVLALLGVGKQLWEHEPGDSFVDRLRCEDAPPPPAARQPAGPGENLNDAVWSRIGQHQGEQFHTVTGLPFTFAVEGSGVWFFRDGKRINRKLTRKDLNEAISRCPLSTTTEIKDLMDYAYLFAILRDGRIREQAW